MLKEAVGRSAASELASAYVRIRPHTSAYVSIRQHTSAYVSIRQNASAYLAREGVEKLLKEPPAVNARLSKPLLIHELYLDCAFQVRACIRQHTSAYVSIRQYASAYVRIRRYASAYGLKKRLLIHELYRDRALQVRAWGD